MDDMKAHTSLLGDMTMNVSEFQPSDILRGLFQAICLNVQEIAPYDALRMPDVTQIVW